MLLTPQAGLAGCAATPLPAIWCANTVCIRTISFIPYLCAKGERRREDVASMPGVARVSLDGLLPVAEQCVALGIPYLALFPVIDAGEKMPLAASPPIPRGSYRRWCRR